MNKYLLDKSKCILYIVYCRSFSSKLPISAVRFEGFSLRSLFTIHITSVARAMKVPRKFGSSVQFGKTIASYKGQILRGYIKFERSEGIIGGEVYL